MSEEDYLEQNPYLLPNHSYLVAAERTKIECGEEVVLPVTQEVDVDPSKAAWVDGDVGLDEEEELAQGHRVRSGITDQVTVTVVRVVGTQPGGSVIEVGQPVAMRRPPTLVEERSAELLQEAIKEGERGLAEHAQRREKRIIMQKQQQGWWGPSEYPGPKGQMTAFWRPVWESLCFVGESWMSCKARSAERGSQ